MGGGGNVVKSRDDDDGSAGGGGEARPRYVLPREDVKIFGGVAAYKQLLFIRDSIGLGWVLEKANHSVAGTYLHGIFDNGTWRRHWLNSIRHRQGLRDLPVNQPNYSEQLQQTLDRLADAFEQYVNIEPLLQ